MKNKLEYIKIGQIAKSHALKGGVKVNIFSEKAENILEYPNIYLKEKNEYIKYSIKNIAFSKNQAIINFDKIETKEEADKYKNRYIYINKEDLKQLDNDIYYVVDIIGLDAYDRNRNIYRKSI